MNDITSLKKRRAYIKGSLTKLLNYINTINKNSNAEDIKVRLANVERYRNEFMDIENKIVALDHNEDLDLDFEDNYYKAVAGLNRALRTKIEPTVSLNDTLPDLSMSGGHVDVKLPKIGIPCFTGDYTEWQSFYDLFCSTIHDNQRLTPSQKLQYLKGSLKGEAAGLLKHFSITDANYIEALKKLRDRYDRKKHTIYAFIKNFMTQPSVTTPTSINVRRLLDTSDEIIRGLKALGNEAESRDHWLIHVLVNKLDDETNNLWAQASAEFNLPTLKQFFDFLGRRIDALESLKGAVKRSNPQPNQSKFNIKSHVVSSNQPCSICLKEVHKLFECPKFIEMSLTDRRDILKKENRCFNCLNDNHSVYNCKSRFRCKQCNRKHHSLVHEDLTTTTKSNAVVCNNHPSEATTDKSYTTTIQIGSSLLPTALVNVFDKYNQKQLCRVLLDSGSQSSFVSEKCMQRLQLKRSTAKIAVSGIGASTNGFTKGMVSLVLTPWNKIEPQIQIDAFVFPKLTSEQSPVNQFIDINHFKQFELADPYFYKAAEIDIIIGAEIFFQILTEGKFITNKKLYMQNTLLGWVVAGQSKEAKSQQSISITISQPDESLDHLLKRFWEIDAITEVHRNLSEEEKFCERHFERTKMIDDSGRFKVRLPFKLTPSNLGNSYRTAVQRMHSMERKFMRDQEFALMYKSFMSEYIQLGHMKLLSDNEASRHGYYLPHHGVIKSSSTTTKLRVVFDGSAKTDKGNSLNDCLAVGPIVQSSLYDILSRFRKYKIVFTADIEKMFRQVLVAEDETKYQRIVWRDTQNKPLSTYELQTITYGTASATFLATRALNESTERIKGATSEAIDTIKNSIYVDDLMAGGDTIEEAMKMKNEINEILTYSGFHLRKWLTNDNKLLTNMTQISNSLDMLQIEESNSTKILGLYWNPKRDCFQFKVNLNQDPILTKRGILSEASRLFDPLGWLAPVTITIKIFFQSLWIKNLGWDDHLPSDLATEWLKIRDYLPKIEQIELQRHIATSSSTKLDLHGFSDASRLAYSAVVYGIISKPNGTSVTKLLSSKTKVAPIKQISIPRLELCGALLLSKLLIAVQKALKINVNEVTAWTDSTIVLDWLSSHPSKWNTFVGNRTGEILTSMNRTQWRHVNTQDNPADCASRGLQPEILKGFTLWWEGPKWLAHPENWPTNTPTHPNTKEEIRSLSMSTSMSTQLIQTKNIIDELIGKYSSFTKIIRILAYTIRFINLKLKINPENYVSTSLLLCSELQKPRCLVFKHIQKKHFHFDINLIAANKDLPKSSKLKYLKPYLDDTGLLRVGGRITHASVTYDVRHPIILPAKDRLTEIIVREHHLKYLHVGQTQMMATLRSNYWILGCRDLVRQIVHSCVKCTKYRGRQLNQIMGDLPTPRVELVRPFHKVGVDYAGPFQTHLVKGRGQKTYKSYICIFICLATKAAHIELVSDLTTEAYIAALRRFVSRRGICSEIHSDNGTNFIGARNHLHDFFKFLRQNANIFSNFLLADEIQFNFIPPSSPHFGGLWEAAVKSVKYHLRRVTDGHILTIEELSTLLVEIEAMVNSRPICILSNDDMDYLTPAHFLIGRPTTQIPSENLSEVKISKLSRWQIITKMTQHIWKRWYLEYLTSLQHRSKWFKKQSNIKIGDIVVIKDNNLPTSKWLLGRIEKLHPGTDNNVRVVTLKTKHGNIRRPIHKLCLLPVS